MKNSRGFTLLEMLIIIIIVSILSIVGKGTYDIYVERSRITEAYTVVSTIINAQRDFHMVNGRFAKDLDELQLDIPGTEIEPYFANLKDVKGIKTKYFRYATKVDPTDHTYYETALIEVGRMQKIGSLDTSTGVVYNLNYCIQNWRWNDVLAPAGSFYTTRYGDWGRGGGVVKTTAEKEFQKLEDFFIYKFW
jgi:type IV pilus assembly protein PilE